MGCNVFANGMEVACRAASGKVICAMPDVCFTPPQTPATPPGVPIPYPNTAMASDATDGSKNVKIGDKEVMLKNKSCFKKSTGDEAGSAPKKGLVTSKNTGKVYFIAWSMNVKIEGENVDRHLDLTTNNHAGKAPGQTPPFPYIASMAMGSGGDDDDQCKLRPYKDGCKDDKTPHHCVPDHCFRAPGENGKYYPGAVKHADGLCVCVEGSTKSSTPSGERIKREDFESAEKYAAALAEHGKIHRKFDKLEKRLGEIGKPKNTASIGELEDKAAAVIAEETGCDEKDLKKQMRDYHQSKNLGPDDKLRADPTGKKKAPPFDQMGKTNTLTNTSGLP